MAISNLGQGGNTYITLSTCTALDKVAEYGGILNPPSPNFESFLFRVSCAISGFKGYSIILMKIAIESPEKLSDSDLVDIWYMYRKSSPDNCIGVSIYSL